jgi:hypothetical protein
MDKKVLIVLVWLATISFVAGCAGVKYERLTQAELQVIDSAAGKDKRKNFGIPFYEGRPYILVVNGFDAKGQSTRNVSVITLPDLSKPHRAYLKRGLGKAELTMSLTNGVLTSTTASGEESIAGLVTAAAGVAVLPANIANTKAQSALAKAQAQAEMMQLFGSERLMAINPDDQSAICAAKSVSGKWFKQMHRHATELLVMSLKDDDLAANARKIAGDIQKWADNICDDDAVNFTASPDAAILKQIQEFQEALKPFVEKLAPFSRKLGELQELNGCTESLGAECKRLRAITAQLANLNDDMQEYLPAAQAKLPLFELYAFKYENGIPHGLQKIHP